MAGRGREGLPGEDLFPAPADQSGRSFETRVVSHQGGDQDQNIKVPTSGLRHVPEVIRIAGSLFRGFRRGGGSGGAARRKVKVQVELPQVNDQKLVQDASRAYYPDLMKAGVEMYEYQGRMAHEKVAVMDDYWATFGSSNLTRRSLTTTMSSTWS